MDPGLAAAVGWLPRSAAGVSILVGLVVLAGRWLDLPSAAGVLSGWAATKASTAAGLVLAGVSLWLLRSGGSGRAAAGAVFGAAAVALGLLTLAGYLLGRDLGIDDLLVAAGPPAGEASPRGRMAPASALNFVLLGAALVLLGARRGGRVVGVLSLPAAVVSMLALLGHLYGTSGLERAPSSAETISTRMALPTALAFIGLSLGVLSACPGQGLPALVAGGGIGSLAARRLLPVVIVTPVVLGWLRLSGERTGYYGTEFGLAIFATLNVLIVATVVILNAAWLNRADAERERAEESLRRLNEELEARVAERTERLEAVNRELEAFSYSVSHDLRAPLRAIDGFSRILQDEYSAQLPAEMRRYLGLVRASARQMGALIDDLLAFSRLGVQPIRQERVALAELVGDVWKGLGPERGGRRVELALGDLPECHGDRTLLGLAFQNLLSNALKFTRVREVARIEVGCRTDGGERVCFVSDNGVGFDMRYGDKLFGVFQRLHRAEEYEGTGVGLAIVQRVIRRHGGRVWAEAAPDRGATFHFTLPEGDGR